MKLRFYMDPATDEPHIYNHGVEEAEVEDVLFALAKIDKTGRVTWCNRSNAGRTLSARDLRAGS